MDTIGTAQPDARIEAAAQPTEAPARSIVVGISDADHDRAAMAWAAVEADPGRDSIHLVHAYTPLRLEGCSWGPVATARNDRRQRAGLVVSQACQRFRESHPGVEVSGSAVAGEDWDVLAEFSTVADLIVVGEDQASPGAATTASRVARLAQCPTTTVPADYLPDPAGRNPVTVFVDSAAIDMAAVEYALAEAARRNVSLRVAQYWSSLHADEPRTPRLTAFRQEQLDLALEPLARRHPHTGILTEFLLADDPDAISALRTTSRLMITTVRSADVTDSEPARASHRCPLLTLQ